MGLKSEGEIAAEEKIWVCWEQECFQVILSAKRIFFQLLDEHIRWDKSIHNISLKWSWKCCTYLLRNWNFIIYLKHLFSIVMWKLLYSRLWECSNKLWQQICARAGCSSVSCACIEQHRVATVRPQVQGHAGKGSPARGFFNIYPVVLGLAVVISFSHSSFCSAVLCIGSQKGVDNTAIFWVLVSRAGPASVLFHQRSLSIRLGLGKILGWDTSRTADPY